MAGFRELKAGVILGLAFCAGVPTHAFQNKAHTNLTHGALNELAAPDQGPDMLKYGGVIVANSAAKGVDLCPEARAHGGPEAGCFIGLFIWLESNGGPFDEWLRAIRRDYESITNIPAAYSKIGHVVHLMEDQNSPPHAANIAHALGDHFESQSSDIPVPAPGAGIEPMGPRASLEDIFDFYREMVDATKAILPSYVDPSNGAQYWISGLNSPYRGQQMPFDGHYGGPLVAVLDPNTGLFEEHFKDIFDQSKSPAIITSQVTAGVRFTAGLLLGISQKLPPLIDEGAASLTPSNHNGVGTLSLAFHALENRTQNVTLHAVVKNSVSGATIGDASFSGTAITLAPGTVLPWEKDVLIAWDGKLAGGAEIPDGPPCRCAPAIRAWPPRSPAGKSSATRRSRAWEAASGSGSATTPRTTPSRRSASWATFREFPSGADSGRLRRPPTGARPSPSGR